MYILLSIIVNESLCSVFTPVQAWIGRGEFGRGDWEEALRAKQNDNNSLFTSRLISFLLSFILSYPFSSVAYLLPSFLGCLFANMVCVLPSFIPSFLHSSSFHRFDSLINFDHPPLPAMRGSQTTMDTARQHPLPRAPPGCSGAGEMIQ